MNSRNKRYTFPALFCGFWCTSALLTLSGCVLLMGAPARMEWDYIYKIGDAKAIGRWGIEQADRVRIADALWVLAAIAEKDRHDATDALEAYVELQNQH